VVSARLVVVVTPFDVVDEVVQLQMLLLVQLLSNIAPMTPAHGAEAQQFNAALAHGAVRALMSAAVNNFFIQTSFFQTNEKTAEIKSRRLEA